MDSTTETNILQKSILQLQSPTFRQSLSNRGPRREWNLDHPKKSQFSSFRSKHKPSQKIWRCGACIVNQAGTKCLMVKQKEAQKWGFPKGSCELYETKEQCMRREIWEETGIDIENFPHYLVECVRQYRYFIFVLRLKENESSIVLSPQDKNEIEEACWIDLDTMSTKRMNCVTKSICHNNLYLKHLRRKSVCSCGPEKVSDDLKNNVKESSKDNAQNAVIPFNPRCSDENNFLNVGIVSTVKA